MRGGPIYFNRQAAGRFKFIPGPQAGFGHPWYKGFPHHLSFTVFRHSTNIWCSLKMHSSLAEDISFTSCLHICVVIQRNLADQAITKIFLLFYCVYNETYLRWNIYIKCNLNTWFLLTCGLSYSYFFLWM